MPENWCDRVKDLRFNLGLTQEQFAEVVGVSKQTVGLWEVRSAPVHSKEADLFIEFERNYKA